MRKFLPYLLFAVLLIPSISQAAIARDTFSTPARASNSATITKAYTNAENVLVVFFVNSDDGTNTNDSCTYDGASMTYTGSSVTQFGGVWLAKSYTLADPSVGTANIVCTGSNNGGTSVKSIMAVSYSGANATPDNTGSVPAFTASSFSDSITVNTANSWIVSGAWNAGASFTTGTGVLTFLGNDSSDFTDALADSNGALSTGSQTYGMSGGAAAQSMALAVVIAPAVAVTAVPNQDIISF